MRCDINTNYCPNFRCIGAEQLIGDYEPNDKCLVRTERGLEYVYKTQQHDVPTEKGAEGDDIGQFVPVQTEIECEIPEVIKVAMGIKPKRMMRPGQRLRQSIMRRARRKKRKMKRADKAVGEEK